MAAIPTPEVAGTERQRGRVTTIVFFIIGLSVILSYEWGAPTPAFRNDAPSIIFLAILVAAIIYIASRVSTLGLHRPRSCTSCGRRIPFDALFCPYCGYQFPR